MIYLSRDFSIFDILQRSQTFIGGWSSPYTDPDDAYGDPFWDAANPFTETLAIVRLSGGGYRYAPLLQVPLDLPGLTSDAALNVTRLELSMKGQPVNW